MPWHSFPSNLSQVLHVHPPCGLYVLTCCSWALIAFGMPLEEISLQVNKMERLAAFTIKELLYKSFKGTLVPTKSVPLVVLCVCVCVCVGDCVIIRYSLKLSTGGTGCEASWEVVAKVSYCLCPAWGQ